MNAINGASCSTQIPPAECTEEEDLKLEDMELEGHDGTWERREIVDDRLKLGRSERAAPRTGW